MGNVITELPVEFYGNNLYQEYTRYKDILEFDIKAPIINILKDNQTIYYDGYQNNSATITTENNIVRYTNWKNAIAAWSCVYNFRLDPLKIGRTYRIVWQVIEGDGTGRYTIGIGSSTSVNSADVFNRNTIYNFSDTLGKIMYIDYTPTESYSITRLSLFQRNIGTTEIVTINYIGIFDVTGFENIEPTDFDYFYTKSNLNIISSNEKNIVGEYKISRDVNRHLKQIERKIFNLENKQVFELLWR